MHNSLCRRGVEEEAFESSKHVKTRFCHKKFLLVPRALSGLTRPHRRALAALLDAPNAPQTDAEGKSDEEEDLRGKAQGDQEGQGPRSREEGAAAQEGARPRRHKCARASRDRRASLGRAEAEEGARREEGAAAEGEEVVRRRAPRVERVRRRAPQRPRLRIAAQRVAGVPARALLADRPRASARTRRFERGFEDAAGPAVPRKRVARAQAACPRRIARPCSPRWARATTSRSTSSRAAPRPRRRGGDEDSRARAERSRAVRTRPRALTTCLERSLLSQLGPPVFGLQENEEPYGAPRTRRPARRVTPRCPRRS